MRAASAVLRLGLVSLTAAACSHNPSPSAPSPQPAPAAAPAAPATPPAAARPATPPPAAAATPAAASVIDLSGSWSCNLDVGGQSLVVDITLTRGAAGTYTGEGAPQGQAAAPLSSLRLDGNHVVMSFSAPEGEAVFDGTISADRQAISGNISYNGQTIPFTARKRP